MCISFRFIGLPLYLVLILLRRLLFDLITSEVCYICTHECAVFILLGLHVKLMSEIKKLFCLACAHCFLSNFSSNTIVLISGFHFELVQTLNFYLWILLDYFFLWKTGLFGLSHMLKSMLNSTLKFLFVSYLYMFDLASRYIYQVPSGSKKEFVWKLEWLSCSKLESKDGPSEISIL